MGNAHLLSAIAQGRSPSFVLIGNKLNRSLISIVLWPWILVRAISLRRKARAVFANTKYDPNAGDIWALALNASYLEIAGLRKLNERLFAVKTNVFDTIAEHNFARMLQRRIGCCAKLEYEPADHGVRPVDFRVSDRSVTFWLQMKRFAVLERENRRDKIFAKIQIEASKIRGNKYFGVVFGESFAEAHVSPLLELLQREAAVNFPSIEQELSVNSQVVARVEFTSPKKVTLTHLTLGYGADEDAVNVTGLSTVQIRDGLRKSAGAFTYPVSDQNINLLVAEAGNQHDIDIANACFGTEYCWVRSTGGEGWARQKDGVFREAFFSSHVVGLIVLRRPDKSLPISEYQAALYINEPHLTCAELIQLKLGIEELIRYNTSV